VYRLGNDGFSFLGTIRLCSFQTAQQTVQGPDRPIKNGSLFWVSFTRHKHWTLHRHDVILHIGHLNIS